VAELDTQMTLEQVAQRYGVATDALTQMVQDGIILAAKENDKEEPAVTVSTVAAAANIIREEIKPEQFSHLRGERIRLMEASRKYEVDHVTLMNWSNYGYIPVLDQDKQKVELDEPAVAYVSHIFKRATELTDSPIRAGWVIKRLLS
jgi:predicted site-specific integrase-resolvase